MQHLKIASFLANLLDNKFSIFGFRFGLDPILGLIPWFGDVVGLLLSVYIIWIAAEMRVPQQKINQMLGNVFLDFIFGIVPIVGDIADLTYKANSRNIKILYEYTTNTIEGRVL